MVAGRAEEAIAELRAAATTEPNHFMLQQSNLERLIVSLLFTWGLARETVPVAELMAERYPSARADQLLVEGYVLAEDYPAAIAVLTRFVEQNPNAAGARARLEELRKR